MVTLPLASAMALLRVCHWRELRVGAYSTWQAALVRPEN